MDGRKCVVYCAQVYHRGSIPLSDLLYLMGNEPTQSLTDKVRNLEIQHFAPSRKHQIRRYPWIAYRQPTGLPDHFAQ